MWKIILSLLLIAGSVLAGFYLGRGEKEVRTVERIVQKEGKETVVFRDRIVTVTKVVTKDGTITETTKMEEKSEDRSKETSETSNSKENETKSIASSYSLGVRYHAAFGSLVHDSTTVSMDSIELSAGRRLVGDLWLEAGISKKDVSLGVRFDF